MRIWLLVVAVATRTPTTHHSPPTVFSFGERACRLFRLLVRKRARGPPRYSRSGNLKLELKQLTRMSLMPDREARPLLLKLMKGEPRTMFEGRSLAFLVGCGF